MRGKNLIRMLYSCQAAMETYYSRLKTWRHSSGRFVFLSAMPKSGSSFLSRVLERSLGYEHSYLAFDYQNIEQEMYLPRVLDMYGKGTVVQQHMKGIEPNLKILRRFGIRPTILTRNLFDIIVSVRDHLLRERLDNIPSLIVPRNYPDLALERQLDIVTSAFGPWLVSFYVSWERAESDHGFETLRLRYEDCIQDWPAAVRRMVRHYGLQERLSHVEDAIDASFTDPRSRVNKGVAGRGEELLTDRQQDQIRWVCSCYPEIDFSPVGI